MIRRPTFYRAFCGPFFRRLKNFAACNIFARVVGVFCDSGNLLLIRKKQNKEMIKSFNARFHQYTIWYCDMMRYLLAQEFCRRRTLRMVVRKSGSPVISPERTVRQLENKHCDYSSPKPVLIVIGTSVLLNPIRRVAITFTLSTRLLKSKLQTDSPSSFE
jgi:hypothetical protein